MDLAEKTCVPCQGGIPPLNREEAAALLAQIPGWSLTHEGTRLERRFEFKHFAAALEFIKQVGDCAEQQGHYPDVHFGWGYAVIELSTQQIGGLHDNDFVMASKVNNLYQTP